MRAFFRYNSIGNDRHGIYVVKKILENVRSDSREGRYL